MGVLNTTAAKLSAPTGLAATDEGTAGTTTYKYEITALSAHGHTTPSTPATVTTGPATLSSTTYIKLTWAKVTGATGYAIYGRTTASLKLLATVSGATTLTYTDKGTPATGSTTAPSSNTTGLSTLCSKVVLFVEETAQSTSGTDTYCWWGNTTNSGATCAATTKLTTALVAGTTVTSLAVKTLTGTATATSTLVVTTATSGSHTERFKVSATALAGSTTVAVTSKKATYSFAATSYVVDVSQLTTAKSVADFDSTHPTPASGIRLLPLKSSGTLTTKPTSNPDLAGAKSRTFLVGLFLPTVTNKYQALSTKFAIKWRITQ